MGGLSFLLLPGGSQGKGTKVTQKRLFSKKKIFRRSNAFDRETIQLLCGALFDSVYSTAKCHRTIPCVYPPSIAYILKEQQVSLRKKKTGEVLERKRVEDTNRNNYLNS